MASTRTSGSCVGPKLHLETLFDFDVEGRITSTREPGGEPGPLFSLVRGRSGCAWAMGLDVTDEVAVELDRLARQEPPGVRFDEAPVHARRYVELLSASGRQVGVSFGPAFEFPELGSGAGDIVLVDDERLLGRHFSGWAVGEIAAGRSPVVAAVEDGWPVSICFCARSSDEAAEAGLETAAAFRGRGLGPRVTAAWARAVRASGRIPLYSTSWGNAASLAVARKLGLVAYASGWSVAGTVSASERSA
jgi:hypothetical protein